MTAVIHQPDFLPYLGFFHRLLQAHLYVILDHVQFVYGSRSWTSRDKIKTSQGAKWLTVPIKKCAQATPIDQVMLSNTDWRQTHLNLLFENYRSTPFFEEILPHIEALYQFQCERLVDFNLASINMLNHLFGISIPSALSSSLKPAGKSNELLVDILKKVNATTYLSGIGAKAYFDPKPFETAGIRVIWQNFSHPVYLQCHGPFIASLSSIDLLFNCGIAKSREILRSC
ncbi:MAG TPA: hypothetical protein DEB40_10830 [Elusimicrobia bacterium]|nr:hypothetical protein [Elusimicrobiota bacterium]HBT62224.1 hypothetical protein [Elusimicrobiota bacterium]